MTKADEHKNIRSDGIRSIYKVWLKEAFSPINDYIEYTYNVIVENDKTAQEIVQNKVDAKLLFRALIGGGMIAAAIDMVGPTTEEAIPDLIMIPMLMVLLFLVAAIIHLPLKLLGGNASFQQTFLANLMITAISPPMMSIAIALSAWTGDPLSGGFLSAYLLPILSSIHQISQWRVFFAVYGIIPLVVLFLYDIIT